jgi:hypothetical protein
MPPTAPAPHRARALGNQIVLVSDQSTKVRSVPCEIWALSFWDVPLCPAFRFYRVVACRLEAVHVSAQS